MLGGVTIPSDARRVGHSDADVACHAATDAMLGAAALGDIGRHFPDTDPQWKGASSIDLLRAPRDCSRRGLRGREPGRRGHPGAAEDRGIVDEIAPRLAGALGVDAGAVSVKGKTNEGVDAVGRGEAIAAHAVALLRRRERIAPG